MRPIAVHGVNEILCDADEEESYDEEESSDESLP
jgi:hypothetical protein